MKTQEHMFLCNSDCLLENNPDIKPVIINKQTHVVSALHKKYSFFFHPLFHNPQFSTWPEKTDIACWHCCENFDTQPIPSVRRYDDKKNIFYVYGIFCSLNCVKAYLIEVESSISTIRLLYFTQMCILVYNIHDSVPPALPRIRLIKFGGDLDIIEFRKLHVTIQCAIREPPFIISALLMEQHQTNFEAPTNEIVTKEVQKSLYDQHIEREGTVEIVKIPEEKVKKPKKVKVEKSPKPPKIKKPKRMLDVSLKDLISSQKKNKKFNPSLNFTPITPQP